MNLLNSWILHNSFAKAHEVSDLVLCPDVWIFDHQFFGILKVWANYVVVGVPSISVVNCKVVAFEVIRRFFWNFCCCLCNLYWKLGNGLIGFWWNIITV